MTCSNLSMTDHQNPFIIAKKHLSKSAESCPWPLIPIPLTSSHWNIYYDGFGTTYIDDQKKQIFIKPQNAREPSSTHAALTLSQQNFKLNNKLQFYIEYTNQKPLRQKSPSNPWEVFWFMFYYNHIKGPYGSKSTYYVTPKTNGVELGKAWNLIDQKYLKTTELPKIRYGDTTRLWVTLTQEKTSIYLNDHIVFNTHVKFDQTDGLIGLYSEDAQVLINKICYLSE